MKFQEIETVMALELGADTAARVSKVFRLHAAGERLYIPAVAPHPVVGPFDTPRTLQKRGVSRRTSYRLIQRSSK